MMLYLPRVLSFARSWFMIHPDTGGRWVCTWPVPESLWGIILLRPFVSSWSAAGRSGLKATRSPHTGRDCLVQIIRFLLFALFFIYHVHGRNRMREVKGNQGWFGLIDWSNDRWWSVVRSVVALERSFVLYVLCDMKCLLHAAVRMLSWMSKVGWVRN